MMEILRLDHAQIMIPKGGEAEARRFYCGLLGLTEVPKPPELAVRGGLWLAVGESQVHLGAAEPPVVPPARAHIGYEVRDLDGWRAKLAAAGVAITDGTQVEEFRRFEVRDPFGNRIELLERNLT
jgi:catechol 2,3-dioxygenase-like lactoylglutathione lyase family enzyme